MIPTFIITNSALENTSSLERSIMESVDFIAESNLILLYSANTLKNLIDNLTDDFEFRLFIHAGGTKSSGIRAGDTLMERVKDIVDGLENADVPYITRDKEITQLCKNNNVLFIEHDRYKYYSFPKICGGNISKAPVFKKRGNIVSENLQLDLSIDSRDEPYYNQKSTGESKENRSSANASNEVPVNETQSKEGKLNPATVRYAILTALPLEEYGVFNDNLIKEKEWNNCSIGKFDEQGSQIDYKILLNHQYQVGMVDASIETSKILNHNNPEVSILSGVCGGRKGYVDIYDIIIPRIVVDVVSGQYKGGVFLPNGDSVKLDEDFHTFIKKKVSDKGFKNEMIKLIPNSAKFDRERSILSTINFHFDTLGCGPFVLKTKEWLENKASDMNTEIIGFEMESYGMARTYERTTKSNKLFLVIKSVMDFTDENKVDKLELNSSLESKTTMHGDKIKDYACYMSYLCTRAILPIIDNWIDKKK